MPLPHQSTDPNQPDRQQAESTGFYLQVLHELINMGTDLARAVHQQATADAGEDTTVAAEAALDPTIAFDRIARTIRRTIVLARHVAEPLPKRAANPPPPSTAPPPASRSSAPSRTPSRARCRGRHTWTTRRPMACAPS